MNRFWNLVCALGGALCIADLPFDVMRLGSAEPGQVMWGEFVTVGAGFIWLTILLFESMERSS